MPISKRNRRGVLALLLVGVVISFTPRFLASVSPLEEPVISFKEAKVIESEIVEHKRTWKKNKARKKKSSRNRYKTPSQRFDPNQYAEEDWMNLGLSKKQAQVVVKFSKRGLKSNADLEKIYVLSPEFLATIEDSTYYPEGYIYMREKDALTDLDKSRLLVALNSADESEFKKIDGIGPYFAAKIINYREVLGGYANKEQLLEIWKLDIKKYQEIRNYIEVDDIKFTTISINTATVNELKTHPYINYNIANSIVKIRAQIESYGTLDEIKKSVLIDEITYQKIKPYISL